MDAACVFGEIQSPGSVVEGIEIIRWVYRNSCNCLDSRLTFQTGFHKLPGCYVHHGVSDIVFSAGQKESQAGVVFKNTLVELHLPESRNTEAGIYGTSINFPIGIYFETHERSASDNIIHRADDLDVGVEIDAAMFIEDFEPCVVADEGIFAGLVCLCRIWNGVNVEVILIPFYDFIAGKELSPRRDALLRRFRQRIAPEPAVMYLFWDLHLFIDCLQLKVLLQTDYRSGRNRSVYYATGTDYAVVANAGALENDDI